MTGSESPNFRQSLWQKRGMRWLFVVTLTVVLLELALSLFFVRNGAFGHWPLPPFGAITNPAQRTFLERRLALLDSDDPDEHDSNRGLPGCYEHVLEVLNMVRDMNGIRGHVCSVGTSEAIRSGAAKRLVDLAESKDATIGFTLPAAVGRWGGRYELMLPPEDLEELRQICRHPRAFFQGSVGLQAFQCPAGRDEVYISPYGDVLPCPFVQRSFGSIRDESLGRIYARMGVATELAGNESLCLAGESIRWMKEHVPSSAQRLEGMPTCATEHGDTFCRDEVKPDACGAALGQA